MKFAVIGHPIKHSLSPVMHNANFSALGENHTYEALDIPEQHFHHIKDIITEKEIDGFNVTIPHKERIIPYLDDIDPKARDIGAVNTVHIQDGRWIGYNTDGIGYVKGLNAVYPNLHEARILILGAGGASKGIAHALDEVVSNPISVANRTMHRFDHWSLDVNQMTLEEAENALGQFDIIINTTPAGMNGDTGQVIPLNHLAPETLVSDIVYIPAKTPILLDAEQKGNPIYNGLDMFVYQGAESYKIWTGHQASIDIMKETVLQHL
ncbi:shikimate dehydrogenase [Staphylococcus auricularis]|uniref:Shikimate dehydrogenase (NADP(+)) n=1 Tax=Staphylococcus auricularis TaxID=29379 RepID=A0ABX5IEY3_9STAP|nr:shikimate dehydrogenase [Staphylococcus auricularis]MEB6569274.1 shikimate dehydrogenase [Staphylococcus auricularis]PTH18423.1 shikimate dehydrogenase [Staphylococcus auricularis]PTH25655.1 shikimate dehydrogenase [Staphylococcus auricularis]